MTTSLQSLRDFARCYRQAIEACERSRLPLSFDEFPKGSCGDVVPLLGAYFMRIGLGAFDYVLGNWGSEGTEQWSSHAWLERDGIVVDITADQFPEITDKVIVQRGSTWHSGLKGVVQSEADYRIYDPHTVARLRAAEEEILSHCTKREQTLMSRHDEEPPSRSRNES